MFFDENAVLHSLAVYHHEYTKQKPFFVAGRPYHSLTYRLSGKITVEPSREERLLSDAGCLTFVPAGLSYRTEILESGDMYTLTFLTSGVVPREDAAVLKPADPLLFRNLFSALHERFRAGRERDFVCFSMFYDILARINAGDRRANPVPRRMLDAKKAIDTGFDDPALSVHALAVAGEVSEVYFRKSFRECFGSAPSDYLRKVRIDNAKLLLRAGFYSVAEVAVRCGYDSISYFSGAFKRAVGLSPSEYRRRFSLL